MKRRANFHSNPAVMLLVILLLVLALFTAGCVICVDTYRLDGSGELKRMPCGTVSLLVIFALIAWIIWRRLRK